MADPFRLDRLTAAPLHVSGITCDCRTWRSRRNHRTGGLVTLRGAYPPGSAGTDDAHHIRWLLREFHRQHRPDGWVLDCRELAYVWGDDLDFPTPAPARTELFPQLAVLRPDQADAYAHAVPRQHHRTDLPAALAELDAVIRAMRSLL